MTSFDELQTVVFQLVMQGERDEAVSLLNTCSIPLTSAQQTRVSYWQACLYAQLEQPTEAIAALRSIHERGTWCSPSALERDSDLATIRQHPEFQRILHAFTERLQHEAHNVQPRLEVQPQGETQRPLLLALHGNNGSLEETRPKWSDLTQTGWQVALAQSGQLAGPNAYTWDTPEQTLRELKGHLEVLGTERPLLLAGFSRGGLWGLRFALTGELPAAGALVVAPSVPAPERRELWLPVVTARIPVAIIAGEQDTMTSNIQAFAAELVEKGMAAKVWSHAGGHHYPVNWHAMRDEALHWLRHVEQLAVSAPLAERA